MAEYTFLSNPATGQSFSGTVSGNVITLSSGTFDTGDVVYIPYSDTGSVFGYCTNGAARTFSFDDEIYSAPSSISTTTGKYWEVGDIVYDDVNTYKVLAEIENGLYSNSYITYSSSIDYKLIINNKRREFFENTQYKSVKNLVLARDIVFSDSCSEVAYGVGFAGSDFETLNNKFKSSLEFNIATR